MKHSKKATWASCMLLFIALTFSSCKKYIYLEPEDATYDQVFWASGSNVEKAVGGAYGLLRDALRTERSHFIFGDFVTAEFLRGSDFWNYADLSYVEGNSNSNHYSYAPYLEGTLWDWTRFYGLVNQCHLIVEKTPEVPDAKFRGGAESKNQLLGQGYFLRAFTYFYMVRVWGEPVLTKHSLEDPLNIQPIARSTDEEVLNFCIEDLLKAIDLLQLNSAIGGETIYADKGAAWALLAQVYAWKHDYTNAKKYCDSVINNGGYHLEPIDSYSNIWTGTSSENIFELFMKYSETSNEASASFFNGFLYEPVANKGINSSWSVNEEYASDLFDGNTDERPAKIFAEGQGGTMLTKYSAINFYDANRPDVYVVDNNLVLLRLADIHLLKAEASVKLNDEATARDEVNIVRARANATLLTSTDPCTMETVFEERQRELYGEGCLAYDNIRMRLTNPDYNASLPSPYTPERVAKKGYNWPLNMRVLLPQNALLTQNEWWKNH